MIVQAYSIKDFSPKKMARNSLIVVNNNNGEEMYIHRRIFNKAMQNPELPLFKTTVDINGNYTTWLAGAMTF